MWFWKCTLGLPFPSNGCASLYVKCVLIFLSTNYENWSLILKMKSYSPWFWQIISPLHLLSVVLCKWWHCISNETSLVWQVDLNCDLHDAWAKIWPLNVLITVNVTLLNFLSLFKTWEVTSGVLGPVLVAPEQDKYNWRKPSEGPSR